MAEDRTFMMGKYPAVLPGELLYARNHMWCRPGNGRLRFGFTAYAVRLMKDVYFLEWVLSAGDRVHLLQHIGHIETSKANSDLFAPADGTLAEFNAALLDDPAGINADGYGDGWLFEMEADPAPLWTAEQYYRFLDENWEKTQRFIKGKINTEE